MRKLSYISVLPALALAAACGGDEEAAPGLPVIEQFEPSVFVVDPGVRLRLVWRVTGATEIDVATLDGELIVGGSTQVDGSTDIGPLIEDTTFVLRARGPGGETGASAKVVVDYPEPSVESFVVQPEAVLLGDPVRLFWDVRDVVDVEIVTDAGMLVYAGEARTSSAAFTPEAATVFTLSGRGPGGTVTATAGVAVLGAPPMIASFTASPEDAIAGDTVGLHWHVLGAERVTIRDGQDALVIDTSSAAGSFDVFPTADETYVLTAENEEGRDQAVVQVTVRTLENPKLRELQVSPEVAPVGGFARVQWLMPGAERYRVFANGQEVASGVNDPTQEEGVADLIVTATRTVYRVEVENRVGRDEGEVVGIGHQQPRIDDFTVTPTLRAEPGSVDLAWTVRRVDRLHLFRDGMPVPTFPAIEGPRTRPTQDAQGTLTLTVADAARFELVAESAAGTARIPILVVVGRGEQEPNDTAALAQVLTGTAARVRGVIASGTDVDVYRFEAPDDARIYAETFTGGASNPTCGLDTTLTLTSTDGVTPLVVDEDDGVGRCSRIDPDVDAAATGLRAGFYFLRVETVTATATGPYLLVFEARKPNCGDGRREGVEQCDDGNAADFDGCSGACELEVFGPILPPAGSVSRTHPGGAGYFTASVEVTAPGQGIRGRAAAPGGAGCPTVDTGLTLLNPRFEVLGSKSDGGPVGPAGDCAGLALPADAFAGNLEVGTHYVQVFSENGAAGPVEVLLEVVAPSCGNGLTETRAGEQCDDGNLLDDDGCSATCRLEAATLMEAEPNDVQATAFVTGLVGAGQVTIEAANDPSGDDDVYAFTVPANQTLTLTARTFSTAGQPTSCDSQTTDTRMYLEPAGTEVTHPMQAGAIAFNDDIDNAANVWCSALTQPLTGGASGTTYFVRIQGWRDIATTQYFLRLALSP